MAEDWRASVKRITAWFHGNLAMSERESRLMCAVELAGEAGELVNVVKKIIRDGGTPERMAALELEVADVAITLEMVAQSFGVDVEQAVARKLPILRMRWPEVWN